MPTLIWTFVRAALTCSPKVPEKVSSGCCVGWETSSAAEAPLTPTEPMLAGAETHAVLVPVAVTSAMRNKMAHVPVALRVSGPRPSELPSPLQLELLAKAAPGGRPE